MTRAAPEARPRLIAHGRDVSALAVDASSAYLAGAGCIVAVDLRTAEARLLLALPAGTGVLHVAVDSAHLYALLRSSEKSSLVRVPLGGGPEQVLCEPFLIKRFALHEGHLFWVDADKAGVMRVAAGGGRPELVARVVDDWGRGFFPEQAGARRDPGDIAVEGGRLVWTMLYCELFSVGPDVTDLRAWFEASANGGRWRLPKVAVALFHAPLEGGDAEVLVPDLGAVEAMATGQGSIVWSVAPDKPGELSTLRCLAPGRGREADITKLEGPLAALAVKDGVVYAAGGPARALFRISLEGGEVRQVAADLGVKLLAAGPSGVAAATRANNVLVLSFNGSPTDVDLANQPDDPPLIALPANDGPLSLEASASATASGKQRALEDDIDAILRAREPPDVAAVERVRVTFNAPFESYWRVRRPSDRRRPLELVVTAREPTGVAISSFLRAIALEHESALRPYFTVLTFVYSGGPPPLSPDGSPRSDVLFEHIDAFRGAPRWDDVIARQRACFERTDPQLYGPLFVPAWFEPLRARRSADGAVISDVRAELVEALSNARGIFALVMGDPGSGKTFLLREVARALEAREGAPAPLLIDRSAPTHENQPSTIDAIFNDHFKRLGFNRVDTGELRRALAERRAVLLLDHVDGALPADFSSAVEVLARAIGGLPATANVIVSCRTTYFLTSADEDRALRAITPDGAPAIKMEILPLDREQIGRALARRVSDEATLEARLALRDRDADLVSVTQRPRFLAALAQIPESSLEGDGAAAALGELFATFSLHSARYPRMDRHAALRLAQQMWKTDAEDADPTALLEVAARIPRDSFDPRAITPAQTAHRNVQCGYLTRSAGGSFSFQHPSLMEWLVAHNEAATLMQAHAYRTMEALGALLRSRPMSARMATFFAEELLRAQPSSHDERHHGEPPLRRFVEWARGVIEERGAGSIGAANARAVLLAMGAEVPPLPLADAAPASRRFAGQRLRNADFRGRDMRGADLSGADISGAQLEGVELEGAMLRGAVLRGAKAARARFNGADLTQADLSLADLSNADLSGAKLEGAALRAAKLLGARLDAGALDACDTFGAAVNVPDRVEPMVMPALHICAVAFHPSGLFVAAADGQRALILDAETGACLRVISTRGGAGHVAFRPNGLRLATGMRRLDLWDPRTGRADAVHCSQSADRGLVWAPDGSAIAAASSTGMVWVYDGQSLAERFVLRDRAGGGPVGLAWSGDGSRIVTSAIGRKVNVWDAQTGKRLRTIHSPDHIEQVAISPDGRTVAAAGENAAIHFWEAETGELMRSYRVSGTWLRGMAFSADWERVAIAGKDQVVVLDAATGAELQRFRGEHRHELSMGSSVAFSPDGAALVAGMGGGSENPLAITWDLATGKRRWALRKRALEPSKLAFGDGGRTLTVDCQQRQTVWDVSAHAPLRIGQRSESIDHRDVRMCFDTPPDPMNKSPDGTLIATRSGEGVVELRDVTTRACLVKLLSLKDGWVSFTEDGHVKHGGDIDGVFWYAVGLARFEPGELDPYLPEPLEVRGEAPLPRVEPRPPVEPPADLPPLPLAPAVALRRGGADSAPGLAVWSRRFRARNDQWHPTLAVRPSGEILLVGYSQDVVDVGPPLGQVSTGTFEQGHYLLTLSTEGAPTDVRAAPPHSRVADPEGGYVVAFSSPCAVVVGGRTFPVEGGASFFVCRYGPSGEIIFVKQAQDIDHGGEITVTMDRQGHIVLAGNGNGAADFGGGPIGGVSSRQPAGFVVRLDLSGAHLSTHRFPGADVYRCASSPDGSVMLVGHFRDKVSFGSMEISEAGQHNYVAKLDGSGAVVYAKLLRDAWMLLPDLDASGNLFISGVVRDGSDFGQQAVPLESRGRLFLGKLGADGECLWVKWFQGAGTALPGHLTLLPGGGVLVTGSLTGQIEIGSARLTSAADGSQRKVFLARFGPDGEPQWARTYGDGEEMYLSDVRVLDADHVAVCGTVTGDLDLGAGLMRATGRTDAFVAKIAL